MRVGVSKGVVLKMARDSGCEKEDLLELDIGLPTKHPLGIPAARSL